MNVPSRRRRFSWATLLVVLVGGTIAALALFRPDPPLEIRTVTVARGTVRELIPAASSGVVRAGRRVTVRAELAGTVVEVPKNPGERVEAGEVIVRFRSDELDARLAQANANVAAARVALDAAKDRAELSTKTLGRSKKLAARGAISKTELERVEAEARASGLNVDKAKTAVAQANAASRLARVALDRATVTAPYGGVLQDVSAELGVQVAPATPLFDLIDDEAVHVEVPIDEADVPKVKLDQTVLLRPSGRRENPVRGKVSFIPPAMGKSQTGALEATALAQRERALYVRVTPDEALRVGAAVDAELLVREQADVLFVPTHVVIGRGITREVFRLEGNKVRKVRFTAGLTSWERTQVKEGLTAGDEIVESLDVKGLEDGVRVVKK